MRRRGSRLDRGVSSSSDPLCRLVERAPDVIFRVRLTPRPKLDYINRAVLAVTGYAAEEWYADGALAMRIVHAADRRRLQDVARSHRLPPQPVVIRWLRRDGSVARTEIAAVPVHNRQGTLSAIEGVARDLTTRPDDRPAASADEFVRAAFEQAPVGIAHLAADLRLLRVNQRLCEMTGFSADDLLARCLVDIAHPADTDRDVALLRQLATSDAGHATIDARLVCRDGSTVSVRIAACRLHDAGSATTSLAIINPAEERQEEPRLVYCGIEVDANRLDVSLNGRRVALTLKEVLLLRYLIRHRGEMLARERLLHDVWGHECSDRSRTLDVHVCRLRRKLPPLADSLATIGHFGYTLSEDLKGAAVAGA